MFGHQDQPDDQNNNNGAAPQPDTAVDSLPGTPPVSHPTDVDDDVAGKFIMSDAPVSESQAQVQSQPDDTDSTVGVSDAPAATPPATDSLLELKQGALQQLTPLLGHLDQTPEEKFRTTMMMIQASDNQSLLQTAYETAQKITDEKARAQALLDVVNEINYFTQQGANGDDNDAEA
jgi:hypothetical protein